MEFCSKCNAQARMMYAQVEQGRLILHYLCPNAKCENYKKEIGSKTMVREKDTYRCIKEFNSEDERG